MRTARSRTKRTEGLAARVGRWLRRVIRNEHVDDLQWDDDRRRERTGKMGENIRTEDEARPNR